MELPTQKAAWLLTDAMDSEEVRVPTGVGGYFINPKAVDDLADALQAVIAEVVSTIIDAGSERDAVMENDKLSAAIAEELRGWEPDAP